MERTCHVNCVFTNKGNYGTKKEYTGIAGGG